jgi:hypothetical protein
MSRTVAALVAALTLSACGLEPDVDVPAVYDAPARATERALPAELPAARQAGSNSDLVRLQRSQSDAVRPVTTARALVAQPPPAGLGVGVELQSTWTSLGLTGLVAVPSCGWWPIASAVGVAQNGQAVFTFAPKGNEIDLSASEVQFFFFVDHDGDGKCSETSGDEVFTAALGQVNANSQVTLTSAQLTASPYSCSLFEYMP